MSTAICFNLDQFKILSSGNGLRYHGVLSAITLILDKSQILLSGKESSKNYLLSIMSMLLQKGFKSTLVLQYTTQALDSLLRTESATKKQMNKCMAEI